MTTTVVFPDFDGQISSSSATYADARAGTGTLTASSTGTTMTTGQLFQTATYYCYETFLSFDVAFLPDTSSISSVTMSAYSQTPSSVSQTFELRDYPALGTSLGSEDFVPGASLDSYTLLSSLVTTTAGWKTFDDSAEFRAATNMKTGSIGLVLSSSRQRLSNTPTGEERMTLRTLEYDASSRAYDPYLTITWTDSNATVSTIYENSAADGHTNRYTAETWATIRASSTATNVNTTSVTKESFARLDGGQYYIGQAYFAFDVSSITGTVVDVTVNSYVSAYAGTSSYGLAAYEYDWGSSLTVDSHCGSGDFAGLTKIADAIWPTATGWMSWSNQPAIKTFVEQSSIAKFIAIDARQLTTNAPSGIVYTSFGSYESATDSYLTVTHVPAATSVSQSVEAQWAVDAYVSQATQAIWDVEGKISQVVEAAWDVDAYTDASASVAQWDVNVLTGVRDSAGVWNVDMFTGVQPVEAQWDLEGKVSGEIQAIWDTDGRVSASSEALWELEAYVLAALDAAWDVTIDTGFVEVAAEWDLDALVASETVAQWDLDGSVGSALAAVWDVDMVMASPKSCVLRWDTQIDIPADNTMTYYFMDAANGEILGDLPFTDVSMSWVLSGSGTFEGSLKLSDPEIILRGGRNIRPGRTAIVADRGGIPIWSGIVWSKQFTGADSTVRITAGDFWTYIKRRLVFTNYSQKFTDVLWAAEDLIKMAVDPGVGGPERLTYQLSKPITVTDRPVTLKYAITDMINIGEAIEGLAEAPGDTGIDFICKQYWVDEDVLIPFIKIGRPYVGRTYEETGTEFSFPGSVISYEETVDASALSNRIIAKGTDDGAKTTYTVLTRDDQLEIYPRYDSAISVDNKNLSVIESTAEYVSRRRAAPTRIATVTVRADLDPSPLDMEIGDWFLLRLEDAQSGDPQERMYRVGGMSYNPTDQTVEISPWVETDEYE